MVYSRVIGSTDFRLPSVASMMLVLSSGCFDEFRSVHMPYGECRAGQGRAGQGRAGQGRADSYIPISISDNNTVRHCLCENSNSIACDQ